MRLTLTGFLALVTFSAACGGGGDNSTDAGNTADAGDSPDGSVGDAGGDGGACGTPTACAAADEQKTTDRLAAIAGDGVLLDAFVHAMPKGGDLHNHLTGAVYAETVMGWGMASGNCINSTTFASVGASACATAGNLPIPTSGPFFTQIIDSWSMQDFVPGGAETGHDHFFATFGKFGLISGNHRDDSIADLAIRAASENQIYLETMFNLGTNVGTLSASVWTGTLTQNDLQTLYDQLMANAGFATALDKDVTAVTNAATHWRTTLGCSGASPPPACDVQVRFIAQISRTGGNDTIFGQMISAFEMANRTPFLVGANLSSPEDDTASLRNYDLHMQMLDFLHQHYKVANLSPLHITLHAGELTPASVPASFPNATTYHIRAAIEIGHAERIGHGLDLMLETDPQGLLTEMHDRNVLVEACLSSNDQILEVSGAAHPLATYLMHGVPVALGTDDQGVSRTSVAGETRRAVTDQHLDYHQLKTMARNSLEHAFLPGASLWMTFSTATPVPDCAATATAGLGDPPSVACQSFLAGSERATAQWELERRFRVFERQQP